MYLIQSLSLPCFPDLLAYSAPARLELDIGLLTVLKLDWQWGACVVGVVNAFNFLWI